MASSITLHHKACASAAFQNWHWHACLQPCNLHHHACILYGDYEVWGSTKIWGVLVSGIGQGNGMGPQIWAIMST